MWSIEAHTTARGTSALQPYRLYLSCRSWCISTHQPCPAPPCFPPSLFCPWVAPVPQVSRQYMSREELELLDVQQQMEEQLVGQYTKVQRAVFGPFKVLG